MNFEGKSESADLQFVKKYFNPESVIYGTDGNPREIKLPELEGEEAVRLMRCLKKMGVILTVISIEDGVLEVGLTKQDAITLMLNKVIGHHRQHESDKDAKLSTSPNLIEREWSIADLENIEDGEAAREKSNQDNNSDYYDEDVLELMEQKAVRFYQGKNTSEFDETIRRHHPRFATDQKLFRQNYTWEEGKLYTKSGEPVSVDEHRKILERAKDSDEALAIACQIHEGLVRWVANEHRIKFKKKADHLIDMDDLLQAGREGLIKAIKRLDLPENDDKAVTLTYLIDYIKGGMLSAVYKDKGGKVLKPPVNIHHNDFKAFRVDQKRQEEDHEFDEPDLIELRENTNFDLKKVRDLYQVIKQLPEEYDDENPEHQQNYYRPDDNFHEENTEFGDQFENYSRKDLTKVVSRVLATLPPRYERVIRLRFFQDKTLEEIAQEYGVSRDRIRQIEARSLRELKHPSRSRKLRAFLND